MYKIATNTPNGVQYCKPVTRTRNLIPFPYEDSPINSAITTISPDGTVTINGISTYKWMRLVEINSLVIGKQYTFSGCPSGGSGSTYYMQIEAYDESGTQVGTYSDVGLGKTFTMVDYSYARIYIAIAKGYSANNLVFKPMLNEGDTAPPFEPYIQRYNIYIKENLINVDEMLTDWLVKNDDGSYTFTRSEAGGGDRFSKAVNGLSVGNYIFFAEGLEATAESSNGIYLSVQLQNTDGTNGIALNILKKDILNGSLNRTVLVTKTCKAIKIYIQHSMPVNSSVTFKNLRLYRLA